MRATLPFIQQKFDEFNRLCFDGQLPPIPIVLGKAKTYLGTCIYKRRRDLFGRMKVYNFHLRFSTRYDLPEEILEDIILHEMIHYYIVYNHLDDTSTHGHLFRKMMDDFNTRFGRHISISHTLTADQKAQIDMEIAAEHQKRNTTYCVAVMRFKDGRTGIKVIPRTQERVQEFHRKTARVAAIESTEFYLTQDPFFSRYPKSSALKAYFIDEDELKRHLVQSIPPAALCK